VVTRTLPRCLGINNTIGEKTMSDQLVQDLQKHIDELQTTIEEQNTEIEKLKRIIELIELELDQNKFYDD